MKKFLFGSLIIAMLISACDNEIPLEIRDMNFSEKILYFQSGVLMPARDTSKLQ